MISREPAEAVAGQTPVAVIDIGSNSGRVVVYAPEAAGHLRILAGTRASLRLVRDLDESGRLGPDATQRAIEALQDFRAMALGAGASRTIAIATAAVREAADGQAFIHRVRDDLGIEVEVIDGEAEARYGFLGAVKGLAVEDGVLFDLGGGSMQLTRFRARTLERAWSLPLGALRLSQQFLSDDPPTRGEARRLREHVRCSLRDAGISALADGEHLVGTGGTVRNLAKLDRRKRGYPISWIHGYVLSHGSLSELSRGLVKKQSKRRARVPGLSRDRGDSIVGGSLAILTAMELLGARQILVSGQGVREGVAYSQLLDRVPSTQEAKQTSVTALAWRFRTWDPAQARRRADVIAALMPGLEPAVDGELEDAVRHAASLLDIGCSVDFFNRHQHTADIVVATELDGFSHREIALVSAIVRLAGDEEASLRPYAPLLTAEDRPALVRAGVLLALADDIEERCPRGAPIAVRCGLSATEARVEVAGLAGWRPRAISERFARSFGLTLLVEPA